MAVAHAGGKCASTERTRTTSPAATRRTARSSRCSTALPAGHARRGGRRPHPRADRPLRQRHAGHRDLGPGRATSAIIELFVDPATQQGAPGAARRSTPRRFPICEQVDSDEQSCDARKLQGARQGAQLVPATFLGRARWCRDQARGRSCCAPGAGAGGGGAAAAAGRRRCPRTLGRNYEAESALGSFLADSLREDGEGGRRAAQRGGLRADLPAGDAHLRRRLRGAAVRQHRRHRSPSPARSCSGCSTPAYGARKGVFQVRAEGEARDAARARTGSRA